MRCNYQFFHSNPIRLLHNFEKSDVITVVDSLIIDDDSPTLLITGCCLLLACRSQMAHPLHQDPQPSEAARRRKRLAPQAVQGKRFSFQYDRPLLPLMEVLMRSKRVFFFLKWLSGAARHCQVRFAPRVILAARTNCPCLRPLQQPAA